MTRNRLLSGFIACSLIALCAATSAPKIHQQLKRPPAAQGSPLIVCPSPTHHDGDAIRCGSARGKSMRLYAVDAPEMPGACRASRRCVPSDPFASRDHLASLTSGRQVRYRILNHDRYGRAVVQVFADGIDVSCRMVRDGYAVQRYGKLYC